MGYIIDGKYHKDSPDLSKMRHERTSVHKQADMEEQRRNHQFELIQPYKNGQPNPEFVEFYPEEAKAYGFIKDEGDVKDV